jgi:hypothetical protein
VRRWNVAVDLCLVATCALIAALLEQDANWDQLQYHYWYPWQLFHGGFTDPDLYGGRFQNPLPQVPFYLLVDGLPAQWAQAALGALAGVAAVITRRVAARVLPAEGGWLLTLSTLAALLGMVGAGFRSELGTSYSDVLLAVMLLGGLLLILRRGTWPAAWAGLLAGAATGLKYTSAPFAVAALVALLILPGARGRRLATWLAGAAAGWLLTGGWWAWNLWRTYDSPVFPFWNTLFRSRWYPGANLTDERYGVAGAGQWLTWPWDMATGSARVLDLPVRDPRWLLLGIAVVAIAVLHRRVTSAGAAVLAFTLTGLVVWLGVFGVIRYAIPAEMLVGVLVVLALSLAVSPRVAAALTLALIVAAGLLTTSAASRRVPFADRWYEVAAGAFAAVRPGDVVLVDGQYPSTFLLPDQLPAGVDVHVVQKDFTGTPLLGWLREGLTGTVWVVTGGPPSQIGPVGTIDYEQCVRIRSNIVDRWLCPLT